MKMPRRQPAAVLTAVTLAAAGAFAGCTSAFDSPPPAQLASQGPNLPAADAGADIRALTQRVNWGGVEIAPVVQGF